MEEPSPARRRRLRNRRLCKSAKVCHPRGVAKVTKARADSDDSANPTRAVAIKLWQFPRSPLWQGSISRGAPNFRQRGHQPTLQPSCSALNSHFCLPLFCDTLAVEAIGVRIFSFSLIFVCERRRVLFDFLIIAHALLQSCACKLKVMRAGTPHGMQVTELSQSAERGTNGKKCYGFYFIWGRRRVKSIVKTRDDRFEELAIRFWRRDGNGVKYREGDEGRIAF